VLNLINGHNHVVILLYLRIYIKINDSTFTRKISGEIANSNYYRLWWCWLSCKYFLHVFFASQHRFYKSIYASKEDAHTLLDLWKSQSEKF
jgi:hypothetical protein